MNKYRAPIPTESAEQIALFEWAAYQAHVFPELELLHHIPNGGQRNARTAARLKAEGVKPGIPDIFLPVARGMWHGLYIELKRQRGGKLSDAQFEWLERLRVEGYYAVRCNGAEEAQRVILEYLRR